MAEYKTIKGYDLERQTMEMVEDGQTSEYLGMTMGEEHYVVSEDDWSSATFYGDFAIPSAAYVVVGHNKEKGITKLKKVEDKSLLEKIALEFHMKEFEQ